MLQIFTTQATSHETFLHTVFRPISRVQSFIGIQLVHIRLKGSLYNLFQARNPPKDNSEELQFIELKADDDNDYDGNDDKKG